MPPFFERPHEICVLDIFKIDKCPNLISSRISFFDALKNPEENRKCIVALIMLRKLNFIN
jgi:hypothetical protein